MRNIVFFWQPPYCFSPWTPFRFTIESVSYSCGEPFSAAEKSRLFGTTRRYNTSCACPTLAFTSNMVREVCDFDLAFSERDREALCLLAPTPSSLKTQPCYRIFWTRAIGLSRKLALTTSYGASNTGLIMSSHASRPYGAA